MVQRWIVLARLDRRAVGLWYVCPCYIPCTFRYMSIPGIWPAYWTFGQSAVWPAGGEIDIIEGVHDNIHNQVAFHTPPGCVYTPSDNYTGTPKVSRSGVHPRIGPTFQLDYLTFTATGLRC